MLLHVEYHSWFYDITWYIFFSIFCWPMISIQYPCFVLTPYFYVFFFVICGVQQTCRRLQLNRNSSQSSLHRISGWANASCLDWIFLFMSWCLEIPAWTSFFTYSSFLDTRRLVIWDRCSCDDDFKILGIIIVVEFLEVI